MIFTVSPMLQSFVSSCATNFLVFSTNLPYNGCFTFVVWLTTIDLAILLLVTTPIRSFLKFLFSSIFQQNTIIVTLFCLAQWLLVRYSCVQT